MVAQSEAFKKAVVDSKKLTSKPSNEDLLEMYGTLHPTANIAFAWPNA
jgi:acyl-CoA-binding protein